MEKYFDALLHVANWGTRRLMFRLPGNALPEAVATYTGHEALQVRDAGKHCIVSFRYKNDSGHCFDGEAAGWDKD